MVKKMDECENLEKCAFFKVYEGSDKERVALQGYIDLYCKGRKQESCIRKKVSKVLGGADKVPTNMKPNGEPMFGSTDGAWSDEVKSLVE